MRLDNSYQINYIAGERVVILKGKTSLDMTKVISLNETAEWLWKQLEEKDFDLADVVDLLCKRFDIEKDIAQKDAENWVHILSKNGIIKLT